MVISKKHLGQHFLFDKNIALKIVNSLKNNNKYPVLEIGPGKGILTDYLIKCFDDLYLIEIDTESVSFLNEKYPENLFNLINADFLKLDLQETLKNNEFCIIGNLPYNISSQIFFKILDNKKYIPEVVCMIQKEVAERIFSKHGTKSYGILSVLIQLFYKTEYLFTVNETVFTPRPKVKSGVIRLERYRNTIPGIDEKELLGIVKTAFNQRRKVLRNSLKNIIPEDIITENQAVFKLRPEQLSPEDFVDLVRLTK